MGIDKGLEENIKKHGWQHQFVFDPQEEKESFGYSIGFEETFEHPEIMIFGLKKEVIHDTLSAIANDLRTGRVFQPEIRIGDVMSGDYEVLLKPLRDEFYEVYAGSAVRYYDRPFRVFVMFWPDKNNVLPTEQDCVLTVQNEALKIV